MSAILIGEPFVFGGDDRKPLKGFPAGKIRIRIRPEDFTRAYVRNEAGIFCFYVLEKDGFWTPGPMESSNLIEIYRACRDACPITNIPRKRLRLPGKPIAS